MVYGWWAGGIPDLTLLLCVVARTPAGCLVYVDVVARTPAGLMISRLEQDQGAQVIPCSMESWRLDRTVLHGWNWKNTMSHVTISKSHYAWWWLRKHCITAGSHFLYGWTVGSSSEMTLGRMVYGCIVAGWIMTPAGSLVPPPVPVPFKFLGSVGV